MQENHSNLEKDTNLREVVDRYVRYWYLFVLGALLALAIAFVYLRYSTATYLTRTTILIKDEKTGSGAEELAAFSGLGGFSTTERSPLS